MEITIKRYSRKLTYEDTATLDEFWVSLMAAGDTLLPHSASVISSTRRTDTSAKYISISASSTLLSRRRYRSMIAVSNKTPFRCGTCGVTSPDAVVRFLS